jgi:hypothetical protein
LLAITDGARFFSESTAEHKAQKPSLSTGDREILASAQKAYGFVPNPPAGAMEQDPKDWIDAAEQSIWRSHR